MTDSDDEYDEENKDFNNILVITLLCLQQETADANSFDRRNLHPLAYRRMLAGTIRRRSLQDPSVLVFWKVYLSGQEESLIQLCGFHKAEFNNLAPVVVGQ